LDQSLGSVEGLSLMKFRDKKKKKKQEGMRWNQYGRAGIAESPST